MAEWKKFEIKIPGKDVLEPVRNVLQTLLVFLEILKAILETIKAFLIDFGNPIRALVMALMKLITQLFEALKQTGVYGYFDVPKPDLDPNFNRNAGGSVAFMSRFKASLFDTKDPNRPQPVPLFNQATCIILLVDASTIVKLIRLIKILLKFFGKEFTSPRFAAPANVKVVAIGAKGDPILAVAKIFDSDIKALAVEWSLPTVRAMPQPGFTDIVATTGAELIPPSFLIEKSTINPNKPIDIAELSNPDSAGIITYSRDSNFVVRGQKAKMKETLRDDARDPVVKFQKYILIESDSVSGILQGALGKFRWIDEKVEPDKLYYYRVRAYHGDLDVSQIPSGVQEDNDGNGLLKYVWPGESIMGKPSPILSARLPKKVPKFNVIDNLYRLFLVAFSLDFHQSPRIERTPVDKKTGNSKILRPTFDAQGNPTGDTNVTDIGRGSLEANAGILATFESIVIAMKVMSPTAIKDNYQPDITGELPPMPWQTKGVKYNSVRMANLIAPAMLRAGYSYVDGFRAIMQNPPIKGTLPIGEITYAKNVEEMVAMLTGNASTDWFSKPTGDIQTQASTYGQLYWEAVFRQDILSVINYIKTFTLGGAGADWVSICILRDIIPWAGDILYRLLDVIQALLDAFSGLIKEIKDFIDMLIAKIEVLERFIKFLIRLLEYIISLKVECYALNIPFTNKGIPGWLETIDTAEGDKPPTSPGGYSAGIALAYVGVSVEGIKKAFSIIF